MLPEINFGDSSTRDTLLAERLNPKGSHLIASHYVLRVATVQFYRCAEKFFSLKALVVYTDILTIIGRK